MLRFFKRQSLDFSVYIHQQPSAKLPFDIFKTEWSTHVPGLTNGPALLLDDDRINWLIEKAGGVANQTVLELGPLEGAHTAALERFQAKDITAIEANVGAFLRCLILKNELNLSAKFRLGDFSAYLRETSDRYDYVLAMGVLYHMTNPLEVLDNLTRITKRIGLWTHDFEPSHPYCSSRFFDKTPERIDDKGADVHFYRHAYYSPAMRFLRRVPNFIGGKDHYSCWLPRADIVGILERRGFRVSSLDVPHPNGPSILIHAERD